MYHGTTKKPKEPEEEFILYLKEHGASEHTVDSCLAALRLFSGSMEKSAQRIWMHSDGI